jgi:MinD-like ATPase involved in chromosome partitioning or flagellar assembly
MGKIIVIHSFRGGSGKSNVTANLAAQIAMTGQRVGIVDTDIQSPGIHVLFGMTDTPMGHSMNDFLHGQCKVEDVFLPLNARTAKPEPGARQLLDKHIWMGPCSTKTDEISRLLRDGYDSNLLNKGLQNIRKSLNLDYLLVDTHPGINEETLLSVVIADVLILMLRPDQQDFQGTAVSIDIARSLDVPNLVLLINKVLTRYKPEQVRKQIEETYDARVIGVLPLSEDMAGLASADIFSLRYPEHEWSRAMREAAETLMTL